MNKTDYIIRQIAKSYKKKYENYVVARVWHLLNNVDIKFVTQQHVTRPSGRALTDMYFPQLKLHIEVDEGQHFNSDGSHTKQDVEREADIINATGHFFKRVGVFEKSIEEINLQIDQIVDFIKKEVNSSELTPWDIDAEFNPKTYIARGSISVEENVAFRTIADACNCFGHSYKGFQRGFTKHKKENRMLWFPKLYENNDWDNSISKDENEIYEMKKTGHSEYFERIIKNQDKLKERLTFARVRSNLGDVMYRFKGVYKLDKTKSNVTNKNVYVRVATTSKTYNP